MQMTLFCMKTNVIYYSKKICLSDRVFSKIPSDVFPYQVESCDCANVSFSTDCPYEVGERLIKPVSNVIDMALWILRPCQPDEPPKIRNDLVHWYSWH